MDTLIDSIRAALADHASTETKQAGASACRAILVALDGEPGKPLAPAPANDNLIASLGRMDLNQILDVAIARLRVLNAANGASAAPETPTRGVSFPLLPVPLVGDRTRGG